MAVDEAIQVAAGDIFHNDYEVSAVPVDILDVLYNVGLPDV